MSFGELAKELEQLQQAQATPSASGGDGGNDGNDGNDGGQGPLIKSFKFTLEDGTEVEAADGGELVKALIERQEDTEANLTKALGAMVGLLKGQGELIKSLQAQVAELGGKGRGRRTVVTAGELPPGTSGGQGDGGGKPDGQALLAKCLAAQKAGAMSAQEVALAESYVGSGLDLPAHIKARLA